MNRAIASGVIPETGDELQALANAVRKDALALTQSPAGRLAMSALMAVARDKGHTQRVSAAKALAEIAGLQQKQAREAQAVRSLADQWRQHYIDAGVEPPAHLR